MAEKAKNIYPCFVCGRWFATVGERKAHKCGEPEPVKQEVKEEPVEAEVTETEVKEVSPENEVVEFDRKEAVAKLKEAGVIADGRAVSNKSDEELMEMLKDV